MKLLLRNHQAPGDVLMLTAAVRDLHRAWPGAYQTAVDSSCNELWENNPQVVPAEALGRPDRVLDCQYPLIGLSNQRPYHFLHGFRQDLEEKLSIRIPAGPFRGDIHLSQRELEQPSPVASLGHTGSYWIIVAGGKFDCTAKWWGQDRFQEVVDHFAGRIVFVQCGESKHWHPPLRGVLSLVGRTGIRDFIRAIYHADGVLCPVTFAMHLAAAVPPKPGGPPLKPCVVVAGGREPPHWEMYPGHQFLHTVGALDCCAAGGCWKGRCQPVGDGDAKDVDLCLHPVSTGEGLHVPRCMAMISPSRVIDAISLYYEGGTLQYSGPSSIPRSPETPAIPPPPRIEVSTSTAAVTIGVGSFAEIAHLAAREMGARTGLRTIVLGDRELAATGLEHPMYLKFRLFDLVGASRVLYFDADIVCLQQWRPEDFFDEQRLVCVRDLMDPAILNVAAEWGFPPEEHFNAGMFIINRSKHQQWLRVAESMRFLRISVLRDQPALNLARYRLGLPLRFLDRRYNWVGFGNSSLSHDMPAIMAHKLAPGRQDLNVAYFKGQYELFAPTLRVSESGMRRLARKSFALTDASGEQSPLYFDEDGTILPRPGLGKLGYWFVHDVQGRQTLALTSDTQILYQFIEALRGTWIPSDLAGIDKAGSRLVDASVAPAGGLSESNARSVADAFLRVAPPYPEGRFHGRGIVICGGGAKYFPCAWVCIRMLRHLGCQLPIELWHAGPEELSDDQRQVVGELAVRSRDARAEQARPAERLLGGWQMKPFALLNSAFEEVLLLDADNVPVRDPTYLFDAEAYRRSGAVFWPDFGRLGPDRAIWRICGVSYRDEPEFESGQILVHKRTCWRALQLTMHMNERSDFYYRYIHGDKDTFHMAWRMLGQEYAIVPRGIHRLPGVMCQHDFDGRRVFQHRNFGKWTLTGDNRRIPGFEFESDCLGFLEELTDRLGRRAKHET